ncbi:MAG: TRAP transporter small permease [Oscillospiraceae bacterium]
MKKLIKISDAVDKANNIIVVITMIIFVIVMFLQVILRNVFPKYTLSWADGVCRYCFIWATFVGAALVTKRRSQITITVIVDLFKGKSKVFIEVMNALFFLFVLVFILYWGIYGVKLTMPQTADALNISAAWIYTAIPLGTLVCIFQLIATTLEDLFSKEAPTTKRREIE